MIPKVRERRGVLGIIIYHEGVGWAVLKKKEEAAAARLHQNQVSKHTHQRCRLKT